MPTATVDVCPNCGIGLVKNRPGVNKRSPRLDLRGRLAESDSLIAVLTTEHDILQAESDSIIYPVLSLPPEITAEIFVRCLPSHHLPDLSPSRAPLLLAQVCHQWRQITLETPSLWHSFALKDDSSVELLKTWLSRAGSLPLNYSLRSKDSSKADALIGATILHSHRWQDVSLSIPPGIILWPNDTIMLRDAPLLRELTTLTLGREMDGIQCLSILEWCVGLVHLTASIMRPADTHTPIITLPYLESFTSNLRDGCLLEYLTLPRLQNLTLTGISLPSYATALMTFFLRSACPLRTLGIAIDKIAADVSLLFLRGVPDTVSTLNVTGRGNMWAFFHAMQSVVLLPRLHTLALCVGGRIEYGAIIATLNARRAPSSSGVSLGCFTLHLPQLVSSRHMPNIAMMAQLRALASAGLKIELTRDVQKLLTEDILDLPAHAQLSIIMHRLSM
ncbi:hypothetical protein DFH07DRAFT_951592 [Mycena maculata]|uniref:F-box domain-containing protein n=1 Tax=Mycena maculata TaxID=230809 RepID=A0AAD7NUV8_9AGAR|nr:hypothetical protein DFH07DRAFT_951592 [Mycena maculata]